MLDFYKDKNMKVMLLSEQDLPFNDKNYMFELKFDGLRTLIYVSKKEIIIKNKNGKIINDIFPELLKIKELVNKSCIFDGEIVLMEEGKPNFSKLQERIMLKDKIRINYLKKNNPVTFVVFDILYEDKNLLELSLIKRKKILNKYKDTKYFIKSRYILEEGVALFKLTQKHNLEGIVAKKIDSIYQVGKRSKDWIKIKNLKDEEYFIGGYKDEKNKVSLLLGKLENKNLLFVGKVPIEKNKEDYKIIKNQKVSNNCFEDFDNLTYTYIIPKLKCIVKYLEKTNHGHLRQTIYKGLILD